jgi:ADP-ribosylglycohydrolase
MTTNLQERIIGCILGGAIGDALGGPYEGQPGPVVLQPDAPWRVSDDTQLTLATCEAVLASGAVSPAAIAEHFTRRFRQGRLTGLGASTLKALRDLGAGAHWALAGRKGERGAGNGAAMRVAPLAFCLDPDCPQQRRTLRDVCRITHHNDESYVGAVAIVVAVRAVALEQWRPSANLPALVAQALPPTGVRDRLVELGHLGPATPLPEVGRRFGCSGYVVESVPLAIFAAQRVGEEGFLQVIQQVVEAGGDTDTIASMTGQIAGTLAGAGGIPAERVRQLPGSDQVMKVAREFASLVASGRLAGEGWR